MKQLQFNGPSGSHCGLTDWYPEFHDAIMKALKEGPSSEWTTGWYSSKKAIASCKITSSGGKIEVSVSVFDDFDTTGTGSHTINHTEDKDLIEEAIYIAWTEAEESLKDNALYVGWSIYKGDQCVETYIQPTPTAIMDGIYPETPPGDSHDWGFQGQCDLPQEVSKEIKNFIDTNDGEFFKFRDFTLKSWDLLELN